MAGACAGSVVVFLVVSMSGLLVPLMAVDMGATPAAIGLLLSVSGIGSLVAAVPAGLVVAAMGTRLVIVGSCIVMGASCLYVFLFPSLVSLFLGLSVFGIGWTALAVAVQCYIGAIGGKEHVSSNFGWYGMSVAVGQMIGPLLSGLR